MGNALQILFTLLPLASVWPAVMEPMERENAAPQKRVVYSTVPAPLFTTGRDKLRISRQIEFQSPGANDLRGRCPGPYAAANHGFLPRNGVTNTRKTIDGLRAAYSMSVDLAIALSVISIAIPGDHIAGTWSIGAGFPGTLGLLGKPTGIVGTHNRYEGDASIVRGDAYVNGGNVGAFEVDKWERLYSLVASEGGLTHGKAASQAYYTAQYSIENNSYCFSEPFSGLVAPDAHNFGINFMSNHSAEIPGGYLGTNTLMSFFAITGAPGNFVYNHGQEQIPANWYKRPTSH